MTLTNAERQARWRARRAAERANASALHMDASGTERVLVGSAYLPRRGEWRGVPFVVRIDANGHAVEVLYATRSSAPLAPVAPITNDGTYALAGGTCHDSAHASGEAHDCTHGGHVARTVGTYIARTDWSGVGTADTRRYADMDKRYREHAAECADCRTARRGVTSANTRKRDDEPTRARRIIARPGESFLEAFDRIAEERERRHANR